MMKQLSMPPAWEHGQPDVVADKVLKRAEVGKMGRNLKARLALAQFKAVRGWEDLTLDKIEPKVEEELRKRRPTSSGATLSDSSSSTATSEHQPRTLMSSPLKEIGIFSDQVGPRSGSWSSGGPRKRTYHNSFELPSSGAMSRKRFRSSPVARQQSGHSSWKEDYQLAQSSPIKARKQAHFTTSSGPGLSFYSQISESMHGVDFASLSDEEEDALPVHSFNIRSSPPRTPPPARTRGGDGHRNKDRNGKSGEEGADLLLYLATSPSPAISTARARMQPPSTPPPKNLALPSSMMTTPGGGSGLLSVFGNPNTPSQAFDFSDFVNITPSPAQNGFSKTTRAVKTPSSITRRNLTFENLIPPNSSPSMRDHSLRDQQSSGTRRAATSAGMMQLGGDLRPRG